MDSNNRIIRDYLESLKEDNELDYIFPLLLESRGFHIISTPRNSKGQSQYGKDVVAIGEDRDGKLYLWNFELKGHRAKDIDDNTFLEKDGVRDSIIAAKDVLYKDFSIPRLNALPRKIVFVHNGILKENTRTHFSEFIKREFPNGGFERWGIEELIEQFSEHLFNEQLLCDKESYMLFKKILVQLDAPGWDTSDLDHLIDIQLASCSNIKNRRKITKGLTSINLILNIIFYYSKETKNLLPAKRSSDCVILKVWSWLLKNNFLKRNYITDIFSRMIELHMNIYYSYISKLLPLATQYKGLYMFHGGDTETVCYPLRCYDFMNDLLYYLIAYNALNTKTIKKTNLHSQLRCVLNIIKSNSGFEMPLLDTNSITILLILYFFFRCPYNQEDERNLIDYLVRMIQNVVMRKRDKGMYPELTGDRIAVAKSIYKKDVDYKDESSLLLMTLFEIITWLDSEMLYDMLKDSIDKSKVDLQIVYPIESENLEIALFEHQLHDEVAVQASIELPKTLNEFKNNFEKKYDHITLRTDETNFWFLKILAHIHFETDMFPDFLDFGFCKPLNDSVK